MLYLTVGLAVYPAMSGHGATIRDVPTQRQLNIIQRAARRHGINPATLYGVWGAESNFGQNRNESSAGAQGPFQFMPATARSYGIDPHNFRQAANAAAKYLSTYQDRGFAGMLAAYNAGPAGNPNNPETQAYIPRVRQLARQFPGGGGGGGGGGPMPQMPSGPSTASALEGGSGSTLALLQALQGAQRGAQASSGGLAAPAHSAAPVLPQGARAAVSSGGPAARPDTAALLEAIRTVGQGTPGVPGMTPGEPLAAVQPGGGGGGGGQLGRVTLAPGADRAGVSTNRAVIRFGRRIAGRVGSPLTIGTGTNHSQMTVSGNVSAHWDGNAADVPAAGRRLIRLGQAALIEAGMPARQARRQTGGLFNVGNWQIIFNTQEGGDHTDHLHYGRRRR